MSKVGRSSGVVLITALTAGLLLAPSCGSGGGAAGAGPANSAKGTGASDAELTNPAVTLQGGSASSSNGQGQTGGTVHVVSAGGITIGPDFIPPAVPMIVPVPPDAMALTGTMLAADVEAPGSVALAGTVGLHGTDGVRQITAQGDIFITGTLRTSDLGGSRQALTLNAPDGTVYVTGMIDTSGAAGRGQSGGALTIDASRVVVTGKVLTAGGSGMTGGNAGALVIKATAGVYFEGTVDGSGGLGNGGSSSGGAGASVSIAAGGDVVLGGASAFRGGAAGIQGGTGGILTIEGGGTVGLVGTLDLRGGTATGNAGMGLGGLAGTLKIGETTPPKAVGFAVPVLLTGGDGAAVGGDGGTANLEPHGGDLRISGLLEVSGGSSGGKPGAGGAVNGTPGPDGVNAGIDLAGRVVAVGGSASAGVKTDGASGGTVKLLLAATEGRMLVEPTGEIQVDGGSAHGSGTAGGGGTIYLFTIHGDASLHGRLLARGGTGSDPGGTGGGGGLVYVFTANGHDRTSGVLILETDGLIDASGGEGAIGGSARNDGQASSVGIFPSRQDDELDIENIAVLMNSDGVHGSDRGWIDNRGQIVARGGAANGNGGDVIFHGKTQDGNETPVSGNVDLSGNGTGTSGDYAGL